MVDKKYLIIFLFVSILINAQWVEKINLNSLTQSFVASDEYTAVVAKSREIYFTLDGGDTWSSIGLQTLIPNMNYITDITLVDKNNVWICTDAGAIFKGALDITAVWKLQYENLKKSYCNYIKMFDVNSGIAMFDGVLNTSALILKTTDGGTSWSDANSSNLVGLYASGGKKLLDFADLNTGLFSATNLSSGSGVLAHLLLKTNDSGKNWQTLSFNSPSYFTNIKMYNSLIAIGSGITSVPLTKSVFDNYYTTDGGASWTKHSQPVNTNSCGDFEFIKGKPNNVWFSVKEKLYFTNDGGKTYSLQLSTNDSAIMEIVFVNEKVGWVLSQNGKVYKTTSGTTVNVSKDDSELPSKMELSQNYPNPFNPTTSISYQIPKSGYVALKVFDSLGKEATTLVDEYKTAGNHKVKFDGSKLSSGIYFYQLKSGMLTETKKLVILK